MEKNAMRRDAVELPTPALDMIKANLSTKKVISFENAKPQPGKIVVIRPIKTGDKHQNRFFVGRRNYYDPAEDVYYGFPIGYDTKRNDYTWLNNRIDGELVLDLGQKESMKVYLFWKNSPLFKGSKLQLASGVAPLLMCYDEEEEIEMIFQKNNTKTEMYQLIASMKDETLKLYGLVFNIDPEKNSIQKIKNILHERIEKDPIKFKELHGNQQTLRVRAILNSAILSGIVREEQNGTISFNARTIGTNRQAAENYLLSNHSVFNDVFMQSKQYKRAATTDSEIINPSPVSEEVKALKAELERSNETVNSLKKDLQEVVELLKPKAGGAAEAPKKPVAAKVKAEGTKKSTASVPVMTEIVEEPDSTNEDPFAEPSEELL